MYLAAESASRFRTRRNNILKAAADVTFKVRAHRYAKHILPDPVVSPKGEHRVPRGLATRHTSFSSDDLAGVASGNGPISAAPGFVTP